MIKKIHKRAFSLIEMSVVLLVIAIIASGMLTTSTTYVKNEKIRITKERMNRIYKALGQFMLKNYRLPCPASLTVAKNTSTYGAEIGSQGACSGDGVYSSNVLSTLVAYGMVPVNALGLSDEYAEDSFGGKIAYLVHKNYTKAEYPTNTNSSGFSYTTPATTMPRIVTMPADSALDYNAFVLISFGLNQFGAFNAMSVSQNATSGASTYEATNFPTVVNTTTATFGGLGGADAGIITIVSDDNASDVFDDIVFAKTRNDIVGDFDAMFLVPCLSSSSFPDAFGGKIAYRTSACAFPNDSITPSRQCGPFGTWITKQNCP